MNIKTLRICLINQLVDNWRDVTAPEDFLSMRAEMIRFADILIEGFQEKGVLVFGGVMYCKEVEL
ncbi:hypothetical protein [Flammeovirga sp. OC4]|uniref:hypothetical protein n=1 Tax=Flammeovirga sp. OC4 TaxID=1382345 RepID=UPI0012E0B76F|nr:hypothetical protein [Flammeovirga sp. OC4]